MHEVIVAPSTDSVTVILLKSYPFIKHFYIKILGSMHIVQLGGGGVLKKIP